MTGPRATELVALADLADLIEAGLQLTESGAPSRSVIFVDLESPTPSVAAIAKAQTATRFRGPVLIGVTTGAIDPALSALCEGLCMALVTGGEEAPWQVSVADPACAAAQLADAITKSPIAAITLDRLLRITALASVPDGLAAESMAYSELLAGQEFGRWLATRKRREPLVPTEPAVLLDREGAQLRVVLNRPDRHNAFGRWVRDGLDNAFDLVNADPSIERVVVSGRGRSFCSGGDLDEFGVSDDVTVAHLIRLDRSVAARVDQCRDRVTVMLHGACIGAGIEIPSFAGCVVARPDTVIRLPELAMGLVPGAGGTVGITHRIGRWRAAYLALSGESLDLATAVRWGLVDALVDA